VGEGTSRLGALPLFAGLAIDELAALDAALVHESRDRGECLFRRGDPGDHLYIVAEGQVAIELQADGSARLLSLCGPGDWFGELALLAGGVRSADARVTLDATLLRIDRPAWAMLGERAPQVFARLCQRLGNQLRAATDVAPRARRAVVACTSHGDGPVPWLADLAQSVRRQFPTRDVRVLDGTGEPLARALSAVVAPDCVVLLAGAGAERLAERSLTREHATAWCLAGDGPPARIRGVDEGDALDRAARFAAGGAVGLALGAGGAYGFAHLGLLRALARAGIPIDVVAGSSMGAIVGAGCAAGIHPDELVAFAERAVGRHVGIILRDLDLFGGALLRGASVPRLLAELPALAHARFDDLLLPFVAIAMDVRSGEEVVLGEGPVLDVLRPSYAIPGIFPPCEVGERLLVDGAMSNPVPVDRARVLGADFVIASQPIPALTPDAAAGASALLSIVRRAASLLPLARLRQAVETVDVSVRSFQALWHRLASAAAATADAAIEPALGRHGFLEFRSAAAIVAAGEACAEAALPGLRVRMAERIGLRV
jgi:NTE family protein